MIAEILCCLVSAQKPPYVEDGWIERALKASERVTAMLAQSEAHKVQILVSEIAPGDDGKPRLVRHGYRVDREYVYPASAIKLLAAVAALEEIEARKRKEPALDARTPMVWWPIDAGGSKEERDPSNLADGRITVFHEIRKLFLVSDNAAFNRLYEFVGPRALNERMHDAGLKSARIAHRLSSPRTEGESQRLPRIDFVLGERIVTIPERAGEARPEPLRIAGVKIGRGQMLDGKRVDGPMDFSRKNWISLVDLQDALVKVVRRDIDLGTRPFSIPDDQCLMLASVMAEYPAESPNPKYARDAYPDTFGKFLLAGLLRIAPKERWKIHNKVGCAYGFLVENAYVVDVASGRGFFLTATIYANQDGILNDGVYEYESVSEPFLADVGELVARAAFQ